MKYLLDTYAFIWLDSDPGKLSPKVTAVCADPSNLILLSLASVWEMQIKMQLGKLTLHHKDPFDRLLISQAIAENAILITSDPQIAKYPVSIFW